MEKYKSWLFLFILSFVLASYGSTASGQQLTVSPSTVEVAVGASQNFTVSGGTPPYQVTASRGGISVAGSTAALQAPSIIPSPPQVRITVTDSAGNTGTATATIVLRIRISPSSAAVLPNGAQNFTLSGQSPPFTFSVTGGSVSPASGTSTTFTAPSSAGTITFTATDSSGSAATATIVVTATTLSPRPTTASPGARGVVVSIVANESIRVGSLTIVVTYDPSALTLQSARTPLRGLGPTNTETPGRASLAFATTPSTAVDAGGSVLDITFNVAQNAPLGQTPIGLSIATYDVDVGQPAFAVARPGQLTIAARTATIRGRILGRGDTPVGGATVRLSLSDGTATSASDGTYSFENIAPGTYTVSASAPGFADASRRNVRISAGATVTVDLTLSRATGTLSGTVANAITNQPIAGARVTLSTGDLSATTNRRGRYTIQNVPGGTVSVTASAQNFQSSTREGLIIRQGATTTANFQLMSSPSQRPVIMQAGFGNSSLEFSRIRGGRITILATVFGGTPPLRVEASIQDPSTGTRRTIAHLTDDNNDGVFEARLSLPPGLLEDGTVQLPGLRITATGSDGLVGSWPALNLNETIPAEPPEIALPPAPTVVSDRPVILQAGFGRSPFTFALVRGGTIEIVVTVVGGTGPVTVEAFTDLGPSRPFPLTDPDGDHIFTGQVSFAQAPNAPEVLPAGLEIIARDSAGNIGRWPFLDIPALRLTGSIAGRVVNALTGTGLERVTITVNPGALTATTDQHGDYLIADVPAGAVEVSATLDGFEPDTRGRVNVTVSRTTRVPFSLRPLRGSISGRVTDASTGSGIAGARVTSTRGDFRTTTESDGSYILQNLPPRHYRLIASAEGFSFSSAEVELRGGGEAGADFQLQPGPSLIGGISIFGAEYRGGDAHADG